MVTRAQKQDSNFTGLRIAEEASRGVLPTSPAPVWYGVEPNDYKDFGGKYKRTPREPINSDRQLKKGPITDLDANGGFNEDLTQANAPFKLRGFLLANLRTKTELAVAVVDGTANEYKPASGGDGYRAGDILFAKGFDDAVNNGRKDVSGVPDPDQVPVTDTGLISASGQSGIISRIGYKFAVGELSWDAIPGALPVLRTPTSPAGKDLTQLGLVPGEPFYVGGDAANTFFAGTGVGNGWVTPLIITAHAITCIKTEHVIVDDVGTGKTIELFIGRALKNEQPALIVRRSYQLERTLGAADLDSPTADQAEYLVGQDPNKLTFNVDTASKVTVDYDYMGTDHETRTSAEGLKAGTRPAIEEAEAFSTSSDVKRVKIALASVTDSCPNPLFSFMQKFTLNLDNNVSANKAVTRLGAFAMTVGKFYISLEGDAYFADVESIRAVRNNSDVTAEFQIAKANAGIAFNVPMMTMEDAQPKLKSDDPITMPIKGGASSGAKVHANLNHTAMIVWFDYLPSRSYA